MRISPVFVQLRRFDCTCLAPSRQFATRVPDAEKRLPLVILRDRGMLERSHFWVELEVDRLVVDLVGAFQIRPVTFSRIAVKGADLAGL